MQLIDTHRGGIDILGHGAQPVGKRAEKLHE
jgi:hypothetical protein